MPATISPLNEGRFSIENELIGAEDSIHFQACDIQNTEPVTILEVPARLPKVATVAQRDALAAAFVEQAKSIAAFKHRSVIAVRDYFTEGGRNYLVTDRIDLLDLASVLVSQNRPFPVSDLANWADTILDGLTSLHNRPSPLIYRSLRPENIILLADGNVTLLPSGMFGGDDRAPANTDGTPTPYSPLEQIWSGLDAASQKVIINKFDAASERALMQGLDPRSDIYSLGATLYHLATGRVPAGAMERSIEVIEGNADPLDPPNHVDPTIPVEVSDVIMKAMEIRREYRFDSAAIMRQVLRTALVRVTEREAEEALVQRVEQNDVRPVLQSAPSETSNGAAPPRDEANEPLEQHPQQRSERPTAAFTLSDLEDDVLGLLSPTAAAPEASGSAVLEDPVPPPAKAAEAVVPAHTEPVQKTDESAPDSTRSVATEARPDPESESHEEGPGIRFESQIDEATSADENPLTGNSNPEVEPPAQIRTATAASLSTAGPADFAMPIGNPNRGGLGFPAILVAAAVLCVAAIGGWFYLGSAPAASTATDLPASSEPAQSSEQPPPPVKTAFQPSDTPENETVQEVAPDRSVPDQPIEENDSRPRKVASVEQPRSKRPAAPADTPKPKKAITVDDLINDN
ncbi:MAG: protein kinase [Pyrinomonadaceae bacterium]